MPRDILNIDLTGNYGFFLIQVHQQFLFKGQMVIIQFLVLAWALTPMELLTILNVY